MTLLSSLERDDLRRLLKELGLYFLECAGQDVLVYDSNLNKKKMPTRERQEEANRQGDQGTLFGKESSSPKSRSKYMIWGTDMQSTPRGYFYRDQEGNIRVPALGNANQISH